MVRVPPTDAEVRRFYESYPVIYAQCRTFQHGPERPLSVVYPNGPEGIREVTRVCQCGRRVTRVFTVSGVRVPELTRTVYPTRPRYLALPGTTLDRAAIARRAIAADEAALGLEAPQPGRPSNVTTLQPRGPRRRR